MVYCNQCGHKLEVNSKFCSECGAACAGPAAAPVTKPAAAPAVSTEVSPAEAVKEAPNKVRKARSWKEIVALSTGLAGFLIPCICCCISPLVTGILGFVSSVTAIVFAILSRKDTNRRFSGMAFAGLFLGVFGVLISALVLTVAIMYMVAEPFLPDFSNPYAVEEWISMIFGDEAAEIYREFAGLGDW